MTAQYRAAPSRRRSVRHESQRAALPAHLQSVLLSPLFYACLIWFELTNAYPTEYTTPMYTLLRFGEFDAWLSALKDIRGKTRILARIKSAEFGNSGDSEPIGEGVFEMRIHFGPGYRLYYPRRGLRVYALLLGGNKSTQKRDIRAALAMARALDQENTQCPNMPHSMLWTT